MEEQSRDMSILKLNEDCILHLCTFLSPIDRFRLGLVSESFTDAIRHFIQSDFIRMDVLMTHFSKEQVKQLLTRFGAVVKRLNCTPKDEQDSSLANRDMKRYFHTVSRYCHNIQEIIICYPWKPDFSTCNDIIDSARGLLKITVAYSRRIEARSSNPNEFDEQLRILLRNTRIKSLDLSYQRDLLGKCLPKLKHLEELNLEYCDLLVPGYLSRLLNAAQLISLNIINCRRLTDITFETIYRTQLNLKRVALSNNYCSRNLELIARVKSLRHIQYEDYSKEMLKLSELIHELVQHHSMDLETLEINNDYTYGRRAANILYLISSLVNLRKLTLPDMDAADDSHLREIVKNCSKLEELQINVYENASWIKDETFLQIIAGKRMKLLHMGPEYRFNSRLLKRIYEILTKKNVQFNLYLDERSIDTSILNTAEYKANEKIFKIHINEVNIDDMLTNSYLF